MRKGLLLAAMVVGACNGKFGDGKLLVSAVEQVVRIRTGEANEAAI